MFKPFLIPNSKVHKPIILSEVIGDDVKDWIISLKKDGCRCEVSGNVKSRELKDVKSKWIQDRYRKLAQVCEQYGIIIEGEFYSHGMSFREICRFFKTTDVTEEKHIKKLRADQYKFNIDGTISKPIWRKAKDDLAKNMYEASGFISKFDQDWLGRTPEWLSTYHDDLKIWVFDMFMIGQPKKSYEYRLEALIANIQQPNGVFHEFKDILVVGDFFNLNKETVKTWAEVETMYADALRDGWEGLVLCKAEGSYKCNRATASEKLIYKMKEDKNQYDGKVLDIVEGTVAKPGAPKTVNALGRSVTSKLAEDRMPSGIASGILTEYEGHEFIVSFEGYDHEELRELLENKTKYIGRWFHYTGMAPSKWVPRHSHLTRNSWRDNK